MFWKEVAPAAIVIEPDGEILTASVTSRQVFDADQLETLLGKDIRELVHPDERDEIDAIMTRVHQENDDLTRRERRLVSLNGQAIQTTVQVRGISHRGEESLLAVVNDLPPDASGITAPP